MQHLKEDIEDLARAALPPHHRSTATWFQGRFDNPWPTFEDRSFSEVFKWSRDRRKKGIPTEGYLINNRQPTTDDYLTAFPPATPDASALTNPPSDAVQAVWIGHATVLVQLQGLFTFLTDPVFAERCSPLSFAGPKRVIPPALDASSADLPHIDAVVLSHNHYDHLCERSVKALHARFGDGLKWFVPLGLAAWFNKRSITNVVEMDWWEEVEFKGARVVFTPAQHWSMRGIFDRKATLWGGWAVLGPKVRFWFAGDTGYAPVFKEIGEKLGPFDLAAIPTGAYSPRWFMRPQHVDPAEAIQIHKDVGSKRSMAIHCATFSLTDEPLDEPVMLLKELGEKEGLEDGEFVTLRHGAMIATANGKDLNEPLCMPVPVPILQPDGAAYVPAV